MYTYKLNHSNFIIVPTKSDYFRDNSEEKNKKRKELFWVPGAKVKHYYHGCGTVTKISDKIIQVNFKGQYLVDFPISEKGNTLRIM